MDTLVLEESGRTLRSWEDAQKLSFKGFSCKITDPLKAYQSMCLKIEKIVPQCPYPHNDDSAMRETLLRAVKVEPWAQNAMGNLATSGFQKENKTFHDEMEIALKQFIVFKEDGKRTPEETNGTSNPDTTSLRTTSLSKHSDPAVSIWFQHQAKYGRDKLAKKISQSAGH